MTVTVPTLAWVLPLFAAVLAVWAWAWARWVMPWVNRRADARLARLLPGYRPEEEDPA